MTTAPARCASSARMPTSASWSYRTYAPSAESAPSGIHQSRNSPMTWSMRMAPACRSTVRSMSRYGLYAARGQGVGAPRRLRPVLPLLVVHVRRRTDRRAPGEHVAERPHVRALRVHADGEVVHDAQRHAAVERGALGVRPAARRPPTAATGGTRRARRARRAARPPAPTTGRAPRRATARRRRTSRRARTRARTSPGPCPPARRTRRTPPAGRPTAAPRRRPRARRAWRSRRRRGRSGRRRRRWRAPVRTPTPPACGPPTTGSRPRGRPRRGCRAGSRSGGSSAGTATASAGRSARRRAAG